MVTIFNHLGFDGAYEYKKSTGEFHGQFKKNFSLLGASKKILVDIKCVIDESEDYSPEDDYIVPVVLENTIESVKRLNRYISAELIKEINSGNISLDYAENLFKTNEDLIIVYAPNLNDKAISHPHGESDAIVIDLEKLLSGHDFILYHELVHWFSNCSRYANQDLLKEKKPILIEDLRPEKINIFPGASNVIEEDDEESENLPNDVFIAGNSSMFKVKAYELAEMILIIKRLEFMGFSEKERRSYNIRTLDMDYGRFQEAKSKEEEFLKELEMYRYFGDQRFEKRHKYEEGSRNPVDNDDYSEISNESLDDVLTIIADHCGIPKSFIDSFEKCSHVLKEDHVSLSIRKIKEGFRKAGAEYELYNLAYFFDMSNFLLPDILTEDADLVRIYLCTASGWNNSIEMATRLLKFKDLALNNDNNAPEVRKAALNALVRLGNYLDSKGLVKEADFIDLLIKESQEDDQEEDKQEKDFIEYYKTYLSMDDIPVDSEDYEDHIKDATTGNCGKFALTLIVKLLELKEKGLVHNIDLMILYDKETVKGSVDKIEDLIGSFVNHAFVFADGFYYDVSGRFEESDFSSHLKDYVGSMDKPFLNSFKVNNLDDVDRYHNALNDMGSLDNRSCSGYKSAVEEIIINSYFS